MSDANPSAEALLEAQPQMTEPDEPQASETPEPEPEEHDDQQVEPAGGPQAAGDPPEGAAVEEQSEAEAEDAAAAARAEEDAEVAAQGPGPGDSMSDDELVRAVSALVFASPEPLGKGRLGQLLERPRPGRITDALQEVQTRLEASGLPLELRQIAGGWRLMTAPETHETVARLVKARKADKLSPAGLETLAVVAYRQPVTKAEIEAIRGVQCGAMLRNLVDRGLARVTGRADLPGAPLQYGTTKEFLDRFGMASLGDLPRDGELLKE